MSEHFTSSRITWTSTELHGMLTSVRHVVYRSPVAIIIIIIIIITIIIINYYLLRILENLRVPRAVKYTVPALFLIRGP